MVQNRRSNQPGAAFTVSADSMGVFVYRDAQADNRGSNDWPGATGEGLSLRGGTYAFTPTSLRTADRRFGSYAGFYHGIVMGFHAACTAP